MDDQLQNLRSRPQPVVAQLYYDAADLLEEIRQGFVILHFVETQADVILYATKSDAGGEHGGPVRLTGRCRLEQQEWHCQVELNSDTLAGFVRLMD